MRIDELRRVLSAFADKPADLDVSKGTLIVQINDDLIEAKVFQRDSDLWVSEGGTDSRATTWIINRVARLPLLADRILDLVPQTESFIEPSGRLLDHLDHKPNATDDSISQAVVGTLQVLDRRPAGATSVLYLTSDAGEGKTTLINEISRAQARAFRDRTSDWLLVPIPLGGRSFLRFDDVVIAALVNRLRFRLFYYEGFLELVRMGVIVPAFDGFEEMFIEGSSGEAISALGNLVRSLKDSGTILVAARKAYFEYQSFTAQTRLFDSLGRENVHVTFARLALNRWNRDHFLTYAKLREVQEPEKLFSLVSNRLGADHPLLTRAVLVKRLVDVASETENLNQLLTTMGETPQDYFHQFVSTIVEREAHDKWLDKSSEASKPLLSVEEHLDLLGLVAYEMWVSNTDAVKPDMLDAIADIFSEERRKGPSVTRQIKERLKQHSLLVANQAPLTSYSFDHEDFREYFLGESLGAALKATGVADLLRGLSAGPLSRETCAHAISSYLRRGGDARGAVSTLGRLVIREGAMSFANENVAGLTLEIVDRSQLSGSQLSRLIFASDSLRGRSIGNCQFTDCYFQSTTLDAQIRDALFENCRFERLELDGGTTRSLTFKACEFGAVAVGDDQLFDPEEIVAALKRSGFKVTNKDDVQANVTTPPSDEKLKLAERSLRVFLRATHVNENVLKQRLGVKFPSYEADVLPSLLKEKVLEEIAYLGSGTQRRFRLAVPMQSIQHALQRSQGKFSKFLAEVSVS
jgi:hypothetical protein